MEKLHLLSNYHHIYNIPLILQFLQCLQFTIKVAMSPFGAQDDKSTQNDNTKKKKIRAKSKQQTN